MTQGDIRFSPNWQMFGCGATEEKSCPAETETKGEKRAADKRVGRL
jgi:hypothetical protein